MNNTSIQFPQTYDSTSTIGATVYVKRRDPDTEGVYLSESSLLLVENTTDQTADLDLSSFVSGVYDLVFANTTNFSAISISGYVHSFTGEVVNDAPTLDVLTVYKSNVAVGDQVTHNIGSRNYLVAMVSKDLGTMDEQINSLEVSHTVDYIEIIGTPAHTDIEFKIFHRQN